MRKSANFASLNAVKLGAGVGAAAGLLRGTGIAESEEERQSTTANERLGKVLSNAAAGSGIGAAAGLGVNTIRGRLLEKELQKPYVSKVTGKPAVSMDKEFVEELKSPTPPTVATPEPTPIKRDVPQPPSKTPEERAGALKRVERQQQKSKGVRKAVRNILDPREAERERIIGLRQKAVETGQPIPETISLREKWEARSRELQDKIKTRARQDTQILKGWLGMSRTIRKSANFIKRQKLQAEFGIVEDVGRVVTKPLASTVRKASKRVGGENVAARWVTRKAANYNQKAKMLSYAQEGLHGTANALDSDTAARIATGVGVAGTGLLGAKLLSKKDNLENKTT
jgi:hypothetical protein